MKEIIQHLLTAPETQLDAQMKPFIEKWEEPPKALQVLEVLDHCIHGGLASGFVMRVLEALYDMRLKDEGITHEQLEPLAEWRNRLR